MGSSFIHLFRRFMGLGMCALLGATALTYTLVPGHLMEVVVAYLLSFSFVGSNFVVIKDINKESQNSFYRRFFTTMGVRVGLVLVAIVTILAATGFHQIYFTVSFIFSYILHSVIEIFTIEKLLQKDT